MLWCHVICPDEQFSQVGLRNSQQTKTCRRDQAADCSRSLDPRRQNREAHSGPSKSVERCHSEWQNADECGQISPTLGCTCRPDTLGTVWDWHLLTSILMYCLAVALILQASTSGSYACARHCAQCDTVYSTHTLPSLSSILHHWTDIDGWTGQGKVCSYTLWCYVGISTYNR